MRWKEVVSSLGSSGCRGWGGGCGEADWEERANILQKVCLIFAIGLFFSFPLLDGQPQAQPE